MEENRTKKDMYNESLYDIRTYINGDIAIKPYYYLRNGLLHVRYTVDRCIELTSTEVGRLKTDLTAGADKQETLGKMFNLLATHGERTIIADGIAEIDRRMGKDGHQN